MARKLQEKGYKVNIVFRKDGGVRISKINGKSFVGSAGNVEARKILGQKLSMAQAKHLQDIRQKKGVFGKAKKAAIDPELIKLQNKINREFKKQGSTARVRRSQIRYRLEREGFSEAKAYLTRALKYAKGYVYNESLEAYIQRLQNDKTMMQRKDRQYIQEVIDACNAIIVSGLQLKETPDFKELLELTYEFEKLYKSGAMTAQAFAAAALKILARAE